MIIKRKDRESWVSELKEAYAWSTNPLTLNAITSVYTKIEVSLALPDPVDMVPVQDYPFIFETVGDWGITTSVTPPEGFVSNYDSLSAEVYSEIEAVQFTITEVGSDLVPTGTTFEVTHRGRREVIHSQIGIFLTAEYARSRGFNVAQLRAVGLIKELPAQAGFGQSNRGSGDE